MMNKGVIKFHRAVQEYAAHARRTGRDYTPAVHALAQQLLDSSVDAGADNWETIRQDVNAILETNGFNPVLP